MSTRKTQPGRPAVLRPRLLSLAVAACFAHGLAVANPSGPAVVAGSAQFNQNGNVLTVTNTPNTIINWNQFSIGAGEITRFLQQNAQSAILNRVTGGDISRIYGTLQSNGQVWLINPQGILIGPNAQVDVNRLVASTLNITDNDFLNKRFLFTGSSRGQLENYGKITTPLGGSVWLIGGEVKNDGIVTTPEGRVILAAGNRVELTDTAGPELSVSIAAGDNRAVNLGTVNAAGGRIDMFGALIEQHGVLAADSARVDSQGRIHLEATDSVTVDGSLSATNSAGHGGRIDVLGRNITLVDGTRLDVSGSTGGGEAYIGGGWQGQDASLPNAEQNVMQAGAVIHADATQQGDGGKVVVWADGLTDFKGSIFARGGPQGGNGGQVETSGHRQLLLGGSVSLHAPQGQGGHWLLDPAKYCFLPTAGTCTWAGDPMAYTATVLTPSIVDSALASGGTVTYSATDYFAFMPNGGTYMPAAGVPSGTRLEFQAPSIYSNGVFDARSNGDNLKLRLQASGTPSTLNHAGVEFDSGSQFLFSGSPVDQSHNWLSLANLTVDSNNNDGILFRPGSRLDVGSGLVVLSTLGSQIQTTGVSPAMVQGRDVYLYTPVLNYAAAPLNIQATRLRLELPITISAVRLGTTTCPVGEFCFSDAASLFSGSWSELGVLSGNTLSVVGPFNPRSNNLKIEAMGNLDVSAPLSAPGYLSVYSNYANVTINAPLEASYVSVSTGYNNGNLTINSTIRGTGALPTPAWDNYNPTPVDPTVFLGLGDTDTPAPTIGSLIVGAGALINDNGKTWAFQTPRGVMPDAASLTAVNTLASRNGLSPAYYPDEASLRAAGYLANSPYGDVPNEVWMVGIPPKSPIPDPCQLNPTAPGCAGAPNTPGSAPAGQTLSAPLTIAPNLTMDTRYIAAEPSATADLPLSTPLFTAAGKTDEQKSATELRSEAALARDRAAAAEAAAAQAAAEASQVTTASQTAPTPLVRDEAMRQVAILQATSEWQQALALAMLAAADKREALADSRQAAETSDERKKSLAITRLADVDARSAEKDADFAAADARRAALAAQHAAPAQKAAAQQRAVIAQAFAEARRAEANARRAEADAQQGAFLARYGDTPALRAAAADRLLLLQATAIVQRRDANGRQALFAAHQTEQRGQQSMLRARQLNSEAQAAEKRAAATPGERQALLQQATSRRDQAAARQAEGDAAQQSAAARRAEAAGHFADADVGRARLAASQAATPAARKQAEQRAAIRQGEGDVKRLEAEARQLAAEGLLAKADARQASANARTVAPPVAEVYQKQAAARQAEGELQGLRAQGRQAAAEERQARLEAQTGTPAHRQAALRRAEQKLAEQASGERKISAKMQEVAQKTRLADGAANARAGERQAAAARAFRSLAISGLPPQAGLDVLDERHRLKTEALRQGLNILERDPHAADLPPCGGADVVCVPQQVAPVATPPAPRQPSQAYLPQIRRKVAMLVGINAYRDPAIPSLESAVPDAQVVGRALMSRLGYEVRVLPDATRAEIITTFNQLAREVGPDDSVAIYYAGHGYLNPNSQQGYWIPADASARSPENWISNTDISRLLNNIPAKQVMLVSDSCYSGALTRDQSLAMLRQTDPASILNKRSVTVMSSGGEEPVSDEGREGHSIFAWHLIDRLRKVDQVVPAAQVFETVRDEVQKNFPQQPHYGAAPTAGHMPGGEFLLERRVY